MYALNAGRIVKALTTGKTVKAIDLVQCIFTACVNLDRIAVF